MTTDRNPYPALAPTASPGPATAAALDRLAVWVAQRVRAWFDERDVWVREDLVLRAARDAIALDGWSDHPTVRATGLRLRLDPRGGPRSAVYVLVPEGGDGP